MNRFASVTKPLMWFMALLLSALVAGCGGGGGGDTILGATAGIPPRVTATTPRAATPIVTGVFINSRLTATFSKDMDAATINTSTFTLACPAGTAIAGTVTYVAASRVATFKPTSNLPINTTCTATITTGVKDTTGIAKLADFVWQFTTGATADTTPPTVINTINANGAINVATNTHVGATFSEAMDPATIITANFTFTTGGVAVPGALSYSGVDLVFIPTSTLAANTLYTATITTGATDLAGNAMAANYVWSWTTGGSGDTTAPTVSSTNPADVTTGICINKTINATFSEAMNASTIIAADTFKLAATATPSTLIDGTVTYDAVTKIASFKPTANLTASTPYTATITTAAKDLAGNALAANKVWTFTTGTTSCTTAPALGAAQNFAVIAAAGITNAAFATAITGDMATQPTLSVTGFYGSTANEGPGTVSGTVYQNASGTSTAGLARAAAGTAYQAAKTSAAAAGFVTACGDLTTKGDGGTATFSPGAYRCPTTTISIAGTPITLDAQGDADAVWIFDTDSTLTTTAGGSVNLTNGAQAKNVFWRIGSSATLGAATFKGTILADTTITLGTTAINVAGRLLAGSVTTSGAVTFNTAAHTVVRPAP